MESRIQEYINKTIQIIKKEKNVSEGSTVNKYHENGRNRIVEISENNKIIIIYSYSEKKINIQIEEKFYEAINRFNEEMSTLSAEYDQDEQILRLKSSFINIPGINVEKLIDYYFKIHDKYLENVNNEFSNITEDTNTEIIGKLIKEKSSKI